MTITKYTCLIILLLLNFTMYAQDNDISTKIDTTKHRELIKQHLESARQIISLYGKKWNNPNVQLAASTEGNWISIREKRRNTVSSRRYIAFDFDQNTDFRKLNNSNLNGTYIEVEAPFKKDGIQQQRSTVYRFVIEDSSAAEQLLQDFKMLRVLKAAFTKK